MTGRGSSTLALLAILTGACGGTDRATTVRIEAHEVILDGPRPLRALRIDLAWDPSLTVAAITAGPDAERLNLLRVEIDGTTARVLLADTRRLPIPPGGTLLHLDATGDGSIRIVDVEAAEGGGLLVPVEVE